MKKKVLNVILFLVLFLSFSVISDDFSRVEASDSDKLCSVGVGKSLTCSNTLSKLDEYANFKNTLSENVQAPDAYHIKYISATWKPSVTRGDPIYKTYYITDNYNNRVLFTHNDRYGYHLLDYSSLTTGINQTAGYYPASYKSPVSVLEIQNLPPISCAGHTAVFCRTYNQANQISVSSAGLLAQDEQQDSKLESTVSESVYGSEALNNSLVAMKLPTKLPFNVKSSYSQNSTIGDINSTEVTFLDVEDSSYITLKASDAKVTPTSSKFSIKSGQLDASDISTKYLDNGVTQILDWQQDGLSYTIFASSKDKSYTSDELELIAESLN